MRVAIMQPTYLPWSGYFGLFNYVDFFVFLDSVQFERRSWQQRNKIKSSSGSFFLSIPVISKGLREQKIKDIKIDKELKFFEKHIKSITQNYKRTLYFEEYSNEIFHKILNNNGNLCDLNIQLILTINNFLGIKTETCRSSQLKITGKKGHLLASICTELGATEYISPPGSKEYLDQTDIFEKNNIPIKYFQFNHPVYTQQYNGFESNLSIIDLLMNCGDESLDILKQASKIN